VGHTAGLELAGDGGETHYDYDSWGNLRAVDLVPADAAAPVRHIDYVIDGANRRIGKRVDGEWVQAFLYAGALNPVAELEWTPDGWRVRSRFVYGTRPHVPDYLVQDGRTYRLVTDHLGSVRLVVDVETGEVVQRLDYGPFGEVVTPPDERGDPHFQPFGFAGGLWDVDTGLVRFGARDYDPAVGRWTAKDPLWFGGGDPNLYAYAGLDPVNRIDPTGLLLDDLVDWASEQYKKAQRELLDEYREAKREVLDEYRKAKREVLDDLKQAWDEGKDAFRDALDDLLGPASDDPGGDPPPDDPGPSEPDPDEPGPAEPDPDDDEPDNVIRGPWGDPDDDCPPGGEGEGEGEGEEEEPYDDDEKCWLQRERQLQPREVECRYACFEHHARYECTLAANRCPRAYMYRQLVGSPNCPRL